MVISPKWNAALPQFLQHFKVSLFFLNRAIFIYFYVYLSAISLLYKRKNK